MTTPNAPLDAHAQKLEAARAAIAELPDHGVIGLGSGSTAKLFIDEVGALVRSGRKFQGVPTSEASRAQAASLGIPLLDDDGPWSIDVTVDGADEVDAHLNLIKGGGAAHLREKIINEASKKRVIVVDASKLSLRLGDAWKLPIEVVTFAHKETASHLAAFGEATLRLKNGAVVKTDSGNVIYDLKFAPVDDPRALEASIAAIPGVVETGFFLGRADVVIVAGAEGVRRITRG
jgi:ribose 5-phosphate isomerase A